jgi:hypothetical protein
MIIGESIFKYDMCRIKCCFTQEEKLMDIKRNLWDDYSTKFNLLSDKMLEAGISTSLLSDVTNACEKVLKSGIPTNLSTNLSDINLFYNLDSKLKVVNKETLKTK